MPPKPPLKPTPTLRSPSWTTPDPAVPNIVGQVFNTDEAAFLAGYLAAGVTKTGKVSTFGGLPIPTVTIFMDGFAKALPSTTKLKVPTWKSSVGIPPACSTSSACPSMTSRKAANSLSLLMDSADIIMPVAGPVGLGIAAIKERGNAYLIGVDSDWF